MGAFEEYMNKNLKNSLLASAIIAALGLNACSNDAVENASTVTKTATENKQELSAEQQ